MSEDLAYWRRRFRSHDPLTQRFHRSTLDAFAPIRDSGLHPPEPGEGKASALREFAWFVGAIGIVWLAYWVAAVLMAWRGGQ